MPEDQPLHMWGYYSSKYFSRGGALVNEYPNLLEANLDLKMALFQIKMAEAFIDRFMENAQK